MRGSVRACPYTPLLADVRGGGTAEAPLCIRSLHGMRSATSRLAAGGNADVSRDGKAMAGVPCHQSLHGIARPKRALTSSHRLASDKP